MTRTFISAFAIFVLLSCDNNSQVKSQQNTNAFDSTKGLKEYYAGYFDMGVAVSPRALVTDEAGLVIKHFNSVTAENAMKMGPIHPKENEYNWKGADSIVAFAKKNQMKMRGHVLVWHQQAPKWIFKDASGKNVSREVLLQRMKDHITTVVSRYKDDIYAWDVVNEAIADGNVENLRKSPWLEIIGEDYIDSAFHWAHQADPDALLFYNDYNEINPVKRGKIIKLVRSLKDKGIPIHGIGLQGHWAITEPSAGQLDSTLKEFSGLGLPLHITEVDISVYPKEHQARDRRPGDENSGFTAERELKQIEVYKMIFEHFRKYKDHIKSVTFWNISEKHSWLDNFPVRGRKDYPLLFDSTLQPKKAYWEVVKGTENR